MDDGVMDQGLDLGQLPMTPQPAQAPAKRNRWSEFAPLLAMLPIAASKGGQAGVAALLGGMQQAQRDRQVQQMRDEQMGLQRQQIDAQTQARDAAARSQSERQRQEMAKDLLTQLSGALGDVEDEETANAIIASVMPSAQQLGIPPGRIEALRRSLLSPTRLQQRQADRLLKSVMATTGKDDLGGVVVDFNGTPMSVDQLAAIANGVPSARITKTAVQTDPKPVTYGQPFTGVVNGKERLLRTGSDGRTYDMRGNVVESDIEPAQSKSAAASAPPDQEWVIRGGEVVPIPKGTRRPGDKPYDAVAARQTGTGADGAPSPYSTERARRTVESVNSLLGKVNRWTVGYGSLLADVPESQARAFRAELDTLKANIAFNELTQMREASKTGGALGQVSERELALLQSALGALDQALNANDFRAQLKRIKDSVERWSKAAAGGVDTSSGVDDNLGADW